MAQPTVEPSAPERVGRYLVLEALDAGGTARVYAAVREGSNRLCVLKQLRIELSSSSHAQKRFQREAHLASMLDHPNIARIYDAHFGEQDVYIAMEHIPGQTIVAIIRALLSKGQLVPYPVTLTLAAKVLEALEYAHAKTDTDGKALGIVHRDLSPRNVMLSYTGECKVIDFGVARGNVDDFRTSPGVVLGTLRYVSPEQAMAEPLDGRSDLYSLGVILYEMLTARRATQKGDVVAVLRSVIRDQPTPIEEINPHVPPGVAQVVMRALDKDPNQRWQSARDFRQALVTSGRDLCAASTGDLGTFLRYHFDAEALRAYELVDRASKLYGPDAPETGTVDRALVLSALPTRADLVVVTPVELSNPEDASGTRTDVTSPGPRPHTPLFEGELLTRVTSLGTMSEQSITDVDTDEDLVRVPPSTPERAAKTKPLSPRPEGPPIDPALSPSAPSQLGLKPAVAKTTRGVLSALSVAALVAGAYLAGRFQAQTPAAVAPKPTPLRSPAPAPPPPDVRVTARPGELLPAEDVARVDDDSEPTKSKPRTKKGGKTEPHDEATGKQPHAGLHKLLSDFREAPKDRRLFLELHDGIASASDALPAERKGRIRAHLDSAQRSFDPDALAAALRELERP